MPSPSCTARLVNRKALTQDTWKFELKPTDSNLLYKPGQFISIRFSYQNNTYRRSYSIANPPEDFTQRGVLELVARCLPNGIGSQFLLRADLGATDPHMEVLGPYGQLVLPEQLQGVKRLILVATGTGIAPYRAMLTQLLSKLRENLTVVILFGVRTQKDIFYQQDLTRLHEAGAQIRYCLSREEVGAPSYYVGYVQTQFEDLALNPDEDLVYLCGTPSMIDDAVALLTLRKFQARQIKREKYVFSGHS